MFPVALPLIGAFLFFLSVVEARIAATLHAATSFEELTFDVAWFAGLFYGFTVSFFFLLWDLLRNKRRDISLEDAFQDVFQQQLWPLIYMSLLLFAYCAVPDLWWSQFAFRLKIVPFLAGADLAFDQGTLGFVANAVALIWGMKRFIQRRAQISPRVLQQESKILWLKVKQTWTMTPSRTQPPI